MKILAIRGKNLASLAGEFEVDFTVEPLKNAGIFAITGSTGSGKSTLLKIIAGLEKSYQGEVVFSPGYSVGYLAQEPYLDNTKTVKEVVMEGVQPIVDALAEYEEINQKFGLPEYYEDHGYSFRPSGRAAGYYRCNRCVESGQQTGTCYGCTPLSARRSAGGKSFRR